MGMVWSVQKHPAPTTKFYHDFVKDLPSLEGKTVAITGCTSGTGLVLARTCVKKNARLIMVNRPSPRAKSALELLRAEDGVDNSQVTLVECDLCSLESVRSAASKIRDICSESGLDVLCNNAGLMGLDDKATGDGYDIQMQANHLGHFLLTSEVFSVLEKANNVRGEARVINHSSGARNKPWKPMDANYLGRNGGNLGGDGFPGWGRWQRYQQSKLANLYFTYTLNNFCQKKGMNIKALCAHPGPAASGLQMKTPGQGGTRMLDNYILNLTLANAQSTEDGALGIIRCCFDKEAKGGQFYGPLVFDDAGNPKSIGMATGLPHLLPEEHNEEGEALLWRESLKQCSIEEFGKPVTGVGLSNEGQSLGSKAQRSRVGAT